MRHVIDIYLNSKLIIKSKVIHTVGDELLSTVVTKIYGPKSSYNDKLHNDPPQGENDNRAGVQNIQGS
jgi:hypothetical protein